MEEKEGRKFKVNNSFGVYAAYKAIRKHKWYNIGRPLKEGEFYAIIRGINNLLAEEIAQGNTVVFPAKMGKLELRKYQKGVSIVNGKLKNTYPIDWSSTKHLWEEDSEAKLHNILLRYEEPWIYHVKYNKFSATYENQSFYQFTLNRFIKLALKENISNKKIDALW